jgi:aspartate-semialdehyde dehydrogenase
MRQMIAQMGHLHRSVAAPLADPASTILEIDRGVTAALRSADLPTDEFGGHALAGSLLPWIAEDLGNGQSKEEWKAMAEGNKILGTTGIPMDGLCIRISSMRCHSQALTIKLTRDVPLGEIESLLAEAHEWVSVIPNDKESSLRERRPRRSRRACGVPIGVVCASCTWAAIPHRVHGGRSAALGCRRTAAPDAAHPARA